MNTGKVLTIVVAVLFFSAVVGTGASIDQAQADSGQDKTLFTFSSQEDTPKKTPETSGCKWVSGGGWACW